MKRKITALISFITIFALLLTGTLAWTNFSQAMINQWSGDPEESGGTLHDDFCGEKKDVYIENWGSTILYVRIRLDEFMEVGSGAGGKGTFLGGVWTPNTLNKAKSLLTGIANDPNNNIDNVDTWTPHIPNANDTSKCTTAANFHRYWQWKMGGQKWYRPVADIHKDDPAYVDQNTGIYNGTNPLDKQTPDSTEKVVTMAQWKALGSPVGENYWVVDADGWAYWAAPLYPDSATGLLLNGVKRIVTPEDSWYYAINVIAQMGTKDGEQNVNDWGDDDNGGWTKDGHDLVDRIINGSGDPTISDITITADNGIRINNMLFLKQGQSVELTANVNVTNGSSAATWAYNGDTGFTFNGFGNTANVSTLSTVPVGNKLNVTAVSVADISKTERIKIIIIDKDSAGVVVGGDGKLYIDYGDNTFRELDNDGKSIGNLICGGMDKTPGTPDDRYDIVITENGTKLLGPNPDGSYQSKGPDGLLGTEDDEYWWPMDSNKPIDDSTFPDDFTQTPPSTAVVISVNVSPSTITLTKGTNHTFNVTVLMTGGVPATGSDADVTWIILPSSAGTINNGILTVSSNPMVTEFQVKATSVKNPSISGTATVKIKPDITDVPEIADDGNGNGGRVLTKEQTGDNVKWVEIARNGEYSLIVRSSYLNTYNQANCYGNPSFQFTNYGLNTNYNDGNNKAHNAINNWFKGIAVAAGDNLPANARLRDFTVKNNATSKLGSGTSGTSLTTPGPGFTDGFSKPSAEPDRTGIDVAFALSYSEAANFMSKSYAWGGGQSASSSNIAKANFAKITIPSGSINYDSIWLRSPGNSSGAHLTATDLNADGKIFQSYIDGHNGEYALVYPAVWVHQDIFNPVS